MRYTDEWSPLSKAELKYMEGGEMLGASGSADECETARERVEALEGDVLPIEDVVPIDDGGLLDDAENAKLFTLARGARGRIGANQGAALRDDMGRTYSGASVEAPGLRLTGVELAVAQAIAAGARGAEAVVAVGSIATHEIELVRQFGGQGVLVMECRPDGSVNSWHRT